MSFIYSRIDRNKWFNQPNFVRFRHRFRGPRESYKLNTESNMMLFELRRLHELYDGNSSLVTTYLNYVRDGSTHMTDDKTVWICQFNAADNADWPSLHPFGEWMHSSWSGSSSITANVQSNKGKITSNGMQKIRHQPESAHMLFEAEATADVQVPNIASQGTRAAVYARANNEEGPPKNCYFASLGNDGQSSADFDLRIYKRVYDKDILLFSAPTSFGLKTSFQMKFRILQQGDKAHLQLKTSLPGYSDSFTGSNSTTSLSSGSHKLDDNATTWSVAPTSSVTAASWGIISNEAYVSTNTSGVNNNYLYVDIGDYNGYVETKFTTVKDKAGLLFRYKATNDAYAVYNIGNDLCLVHTWLFQTLAGSGNNRAAVSGDVIRVEFKEDRITVYKNGNVAIIYDEPYPTNDLNHTKVGFFTGLGVAGSSNSGRFDDFSAGKTENEYVEAGQQYLSLPGSSGNFAYTETKLDHVYLPGLIGNYLSSPDSSGFDITQDLELVARIALDRYDGVSSSPQTIISKWNSDSANRSYWLRIDTDKKLRLSVSDNGSNNLYAKSKSVLPWADGQAGWVKATLTVASGKVSFYIADDQEEEPSAWVPLGPRMIDLSTPGALTLFNSTTPLAIGAINASSTSNAALGYRAAGKFYRAIVRRGIDGTKVADFDPRFFTSTAETTLLASTGETWTLNTTGGTKATINADLHSTKSLEVSAKMSIDWESTDNQTIMARSNASSGNASWAFRTVSGGNLALVTSKAGTNAAEYVYTSTAQVPFLPNQIGWVKVTHDTASGGNYASMQKIAGNLLKTQDFSLDIGSSFDLRIKLSTNWVSNDSVAQSLFAKWKTIVFQYNGNRTLQLLVLTDGVNYQSYNSTVGLSNPADGEVFWVRAVYTGDTGNSTSEVIFYTSTNGITWTQLGAARTAAVLTSPYVTTSPITIGHNLTNATTPINQTLGHFYKVQLFKDNGTTIVTDVDFDKVIPGSSSFYDQQGNNWTLTTSSTPGIKITSDSVTKFYTSINGVNWKQLGNTLTSTDAPAPIYPGVARLTVGARNDVGTTNQLSGHIYEAVMRNTIDGDAIAKPNFSTDPDVGDVQFTDGTNRDWVISQVVSTSGIAEVEVEDTAIGNDAISVLDETDGIADTAGSWGLLTECIGGVGETVSWDNFKLSADTTMHMFAGLDEIAFKVMNLHQRLSKLEDKK